MGSSISSPTSGTLENETAETTKLEEKEPHSSTVSALENQDQANPVLRDQVSVSSNGEKGKGEERGLYSLMKEGACKDKYNAWEECVKEGCEKDEDVRVKCGKLLSSLEECVIVHPEHYEPLLKEACWFREEGGCKDTYIAWEDCLIKAVEADEEDLIGKCREVGSLLRECMVAHSDHYGPVLNALQAVETEKEEDEEAAKKKMEILSQNLEKLFSEN
ncbi:hypothetical protein MKW92_033735 [Papaver armeniacum]|nr:hypothetical protein MKW92_033735 [Papaver armeniacum]